MACSLAVVSRKWDHLLLLAFQPAPSQYLHGTRQDSQGSDSTVGSGDNPPTDITSAISCCSPRSQPLSQYMFGSRQNSNGSDLMVGSGINQSSQAGCTMLLVSGWLIAVKAAHAASDLNWASRRSSEVPAGVRREYFLRDN
jgi:hypothetical protein